MRFTAPAGEALTVVPDDDDDDDGVGRAGAQAVNVASRANSAMTPLFMDWR
jgi:hypothetical protein